MCLPCVGACGAVAFCGVVFVCVCSLVTWSSVARCESRVRVCVFHPCSLPSMVSEAGACDLLLGSVLRVFAASGPVLGVERALRGFFYGLVCVCSVFIWSA